MLTNLFIYISYTFNITKEWLIPAELAGADIKQKLIELLADFII